LTFFGERRLERHVSVSFITYIEDMSDLRESKTSHGTRCISKANHAALSSDKGETAVESRFSNGVKHGVDAFATSDLEYFLHKNIAVIFMVLKHHFRSIVLGQLTLLWGTRSSDGPRANGFQELAEPQSYTTSCGGDEDPFAFLHSMCITDQGHCGQGLEKGCCCGLGLDGVGERDGVVARCSGVLCVGVLTHVCYPSADGEIGGGVGSDSGNGSRTFAAKDVGEAGRVIDTGAEVTGSC
jgi:hypothetical protein